jgi:hypothetical protein
MKLTSTQFRALHYIGRYQGDEAKVGSILSQCLLDRLKDLGLVVENNGIIVLTRAGEQEFTRLCPNSKYRVH